MTRSADQTPDFALPDQSQAARTFADLSGPKGLVIYVYPKDNTPGCSLEAQEFRDRLPEFNRLGYNVAGVSRDSVKSHLNFAEKYGLNFPLLSDPERVLIEALGAWGEKKNYGKTTMGVIRSTYVFDRQGKLTRSYPQVKAAGHAEQVLRDLAE